MVPKLSPLLLQGQMANGAALAGRENAWQIEYFQAAFVFEDVF